MQFKEPIPEMEITYEEESFATWAALGHTKMEELLPACYGRASGPGTKRASEP